MELDLRDEHLFELQGILTENPGICSADIFERSQLFSCREDLSKTLYVCRKTGMVSMKDGCYMLKQGLITLLAGDLNPSSKEGKIAYLLYSNRDMEFETAKIAELTSIPANLIYYHLSQLVSREYISRTGYRRTLRFAWSGRYAHPFEHADTKAEVIQPSKERSKEELSEAVDALIEDAKAMRLKLSALMDQQSAIIMSLGELREELKH